MRGMDSFPSLSSMKSFSFNFLSLASICIGYGVYSSIRRSLAIALPLLITDLHLTKADIGLITSSFSLAYGLSKFLWSVACDQFSCKILFVFGLLSTSLLCVAFTMGESVEYLTLVWFLNGCVQGVGWPAIASIIFNNFDSSQRGTVWSTATSSGNVGYMLGPFLFTLLLSFGWKGPFIGAALCGLLAVPLCMYFITDRGLPLKETDDASSSPNTIADSKNGIIDRYRWLVDFPLWCLLLSNGFTYFILKGISDWIGLYVVEYCHWSTSVSTLMLFWYEVGGMFGSISCGVVSDSLFHQKRDITSLIYTLVMIPAILCIPIITLHSGEETPWAAILMSCCLFLIGVGVNGPKTLIGVSVRECVPSDAIGLAGGILGIVGQFGGATAGVAFGYALQSYGWQIFMPFLCISSIICAVLILCYIVFHRNPSWSKSKGK